MTESLPPIKNYLSWQAELGGEDFYFQAEVAELIKKSLNQPGNTHVSRSVEATAYTAAPAWPNPKKSLDSKLSLLQQFQALTKSGPRPETPVKTGAHSPAPKPKMLKGEKESPSAFISIEGVLEELEKRELNVLKKLGKETKYPILRPNGPVPSNLAIITDAPGEDDGALGEILKGEDGQLLDKMLSAIGIERKKVYCTAIVKNQELSRQIFLTQKKKHLDLLFEELKMSGCKIWIVLGEAANQLLLNTGKNLSSLRQQRHRLLKNDILKDVSVFSLEHPNAIKSDLAKKKEAWVDLQWIQKQIQ